MDNKDTTAKKILVSDDDLAILDAIRMILEDEGYEVTTQPEGQKLYDLKGELPDLILLDVWMSGVDGRDICKYLKSKEETKHIPIIMISANNSTERIATEAGANGFITKPFELTRLLATVKKHLESDLDLVPC